MKILILGYGKTGKDLFEFLQNDNEVYIYEEKNLDFINYYSYQKLKKELPFFDYIIRSPGIPSTSKIYRLCLQLTFNLVSEIEFFNKYFKNNIIIGVTGSNGKTTLVSMLYHILKIKYNVHLLGNIGITISSQIKNIKPKDILIFELSSFQLEDTKSLTMDYGIITNLSNNHLDKVMNKSYYFASKLKLVKMCKKLYVSKRIKKYIFHQDITYIENIKAPLISSLNRINQLHFNVVFDIARKFNISSEEIVNEIVSFKFPTYRNQITYKKENLIFVNDSKSTSVSSTNACLSLYNDKKRIIILGGISKSGSFKKLKLKKDDVILSFGQCKYKIFKEIRGLYFNSLKSLIEHLRLVRDEYYVIFSPGCASLDEYTSYKDRGDEFEKLIRTCIS